jgi:hypothetical protein
MPPLFPCPNPTCTHTFSPESVKGVSSLKCPKCGTIFQFGPRQSTAAQPSGTRKVPATAPVAKPRPAPPKVVPPVPAPPIAVPVAAPVETVQTSDALNFDAATDTVVPPTRRRAGKRGKKRLAPVLALIVVIGLGIAVAVWGGMWLIHLNKTDSTSDDPIRAVSQANNFRFPLPGKPWRRDANLELKMHVNLGMRSTDHNSGMALFFKDYKTRLPSDAELVDEALGKIRAYFQGVEWEQKPRDDEVTLGGHPALYLAFVAEDAEHVPMKGECHMVAFRGFAYWFFTWTPDDDNKDASRAQGDELRQSFQLLDGRKGWTEKLPETEKARGKKAKYQLSYVKGLWARMNAPEDYDPLADLVLQGEEPDPSRKISTTKRATFQILVLPKQANLKAAIAAARDYVKKREEALYSQTKLQPIKDKSGADSDRTTDIGNEPGHLSKLDVRNTDDLQRFMVLAIVNRPDGVLVLVGECLWERRDFWDQEFTSLLKSFKAR